MFWKKANNNNSISCGSLQSHSLPHPHLPNLQFLLSLHDAIACMNDRLTRHKIIRAELHDSKLVIISISFLAAARIAA